MRPEILFPLFRQISTLQGVGPRYAALIGKLTGEKALDLIWHRPSHAIDRSRKLAPTDTLNVFESGAYVTLALDVQGHVPATPPKGRRPYRVHCTFGKQALDLVYFNTREAFLQDLLPVKETRLVSGQLDLRPGNRPQMLHPDYVVGLDKEDEIPAFEPVYPLTAGLPAKIMRKTVKKALALAPDLPEWLDENLLKSMSWPTWRHALNQLHFCETKPSQDTARAALKRLSFDELLADQLSLIIAREMAKKQPGQAYVFDDEKMAQLMDGLPFEPTEDQKQAFAEIRNDLELSHRMSRLLQGDVGSGKTLVALMAMAMVVHNGKQAALMAPTDLLARQHFFSLTNLTKNANLRIGLLTGKLGQAESRRIRGNLAEGSLDVVVGTHALFQESVVFRDLGLIIIDEQHRFGVEQRQALQSKGRQTELLTMTATPIPRTLAMTQYGDMDISRIMHKPAGRVPVQTAKANLDSLSQVFARLSKAMQADPDLQIYWVCPLVEESEHLDLMAAQERFSTIEHYFGEGTGALVHGQLSVEDKQAAMDSFVAKEKRILVATTVIEVGVDVPNASIMIIEQAERFGLAQMHQLRGRVGRGSKASSCLLLYQSPLGQNAAVKIGTMVKTDDGFEIAEEDLRLRGIGEVLGTKQTGLPGYRLADMEQDGNLMENARRFAELLMNKADYQPANLSEPVKILLYLFEKDQALKYRRA